MRWVAARINTIAVALRKESVDRNFDRYTVISTSSCRSPQGERG